MKKLFRLLVLLFLIPVFSSCDLYCAWLISELDNLGEGWGYDPYDKQLRFNKKGDDALINVKDHYQFYVIKIQSDTIYWSEDASYMEKSIEKGYSFETNDRYISGEGMVLDATFGVKFKIELDRNPYDEPREVFVETASYRYEDGDKRCRYRRYLFTQDYFENEVGE